MRVRVRVSICKRTVEWGPSISCTSEGEIAHAGVGMELGESEGAGGMRAGCGRDACAGGGDTSSAACSTAAFAASRLWGGCRLALVPVPLAAAVSASWAAGVGEAEGVTYTSSPSALEPPLDAPLEAPLGAGLRRSRLGGASSAVSAKSGSR